MRRSTRRRFLLTASSFLIGSVAGVFAYRGVGGHAAVVGAAPDTAPRDPASLERGTIDWALAMVHATDAELVAAAGDLERVAVRNRDEPRLLACFERLLDAAVHRPDSAADAAAACAIRSLVRLGEPALALDRERDIAARADFVEAPQALERARRARGHR